ncbi:MAG: hypothetical protein KKD38_03300 [Candidatus Delongbacteria bacterium]|nr:hypothetical protein [Candidatus Delongbacteria bacterium]MCG2761485.1 hypothetical protein [Candidatus Delongbacteria bacterium]
MCNGHHEHHGKHHHHGHHHHHEEKCKCTEHEIQCGCEKREMETKCGCGGHHGFKRKFISKEEIIEELETYKALLLKEVKGVEEEIEEHKK